MTCLGRAPAIPTVCGCPRSCCEPDPRSPRALPYYARFLSRFPDVAALAVASQDEVLALLERPGLLPSGAHAAPLRPGDRVRARRALPGHARGAGRPCPASAVRRRRRSRCSASAGARRSWTATSSACWPCVLAADEDLATSEGLRRAVDAGRGPLARGGHRGLHPGSDGPGRHGLRPALAAMRGLSRGDDLRGPSAGKHGVLPAQVAAGAPRRTRIGVAVAAVARPGVDGCGGRSTASGRRCGACPSSRTSTRSRRPPMVGRATERGWSRCCTC